MQIRFADTQVATRSLLRLLAAPSRYVIDAVFYGVIACIMSIAVMAAVDALSTPFAAEMLAIINDL